MILNRIARSARTLYPDGINFAISEDRTKITYAEHFTVVVVYEGAFDGWYRGGVRAHVAGSPYEYLTYLRVSRARELLRRGALVAQAAQAVGFYDESQLHRHFRRIVGVPPGVYARSFVSSARTGQHRPRRAGDGDASSPHERTCSQ